MGGSSGVSQLGVYGEKSILNAENYPGSRVNALSLYDSCTHTFLLFGGNGYDSVHYGKYITINPFF
mgnify:FL=1